VSLFGTTTNITNNNKTMTQLNIEHTVAEIERLHEIIDGKQILQSAIDAGHLLVAIKDSDAVKHGDWKRWVKENFESVSYRTTVRYMSLATYEQLVKDCDTLTEAYEMIAEHRRNEKKESEPDTTEAKSENTEQQEDVPTESEETARLIFIQQVNGELTKQKVNWDVTTWTVENERPNSNDDINRLLRTVKSLRNLVAHRCFTSLTPQEETEMKVEIMLEALLTFVIQNTNKVAPIPEPVAV